MTTTEKLQAIKTKCQELLAIAERRTPGEWRSSHYENAERWQIDVYFSPCSGMIIGHCGPKGEHESKFIAACAGNAEAGWRSTIAAIDLLLELPSPDANLVLSRILTAWEGLV